MSIVLDQGPDMAGVRELLKTVTGQLYRREVRIFHRPLDFFKEVGISIDAILDKHQSVKKLRGESWAKENASSANKYNLFFAQSPRGIVSTSQVLDYALHRWGVPLCVPLLLEKDLEKQKKESPQPLVDYLENFPSAEIMATELKDSERYGLGSAVGDKACHLFAKIYVSILKLVKHRKGDPGWTDLSYEVPFDSNAGRVLFRTGFLSEWASIADYKDWDVIQAREGKGDTDYIRVTNIRGKKTKKIEKDSHTFEEYVRLSTQMLQTDSRPQKVEIQRIPSVVLLQLAGKGLTFSVADFDDGLMQIGTKFCFNHEKPKCEKCPVRDICVGYNRERKLISGYTT